MELSIVIPCLNEEKTLPIVIDKALKSLQRLRITGEVIVADNGSNDDSVNIAKQHGARVVHVKNRGYGNALIAGMNDAKGKYLLMGDADDSYNFEEIDEFLNQIRKGYDLVIGTRLRGRIEEGAMPFLHRYLGTPVLTKIINVLFKLRISDCNCGMRCLTAEAFRRMNLKSSGMEFASEMLIKAGLLKIRIKEIPITLYRDKRDRPPHLHTWRDGWRHLRFMMLYSPTHVFVLPGLLMMFLGFAIMVFLLKGPVSLYGKIIDYHTALLGSLLFILGFQTVLTGLQARIFASNQDFKFKDTQIDRFAKFFTLEKGILIGALLFFAGFILDATVLWEWANAGYKDLHEASKIAFSSTMMIVGVQTFFSAFFVSLLNQKRLD